MFLFGFRCPFNHLSCKEFRRLDKYVTSVTHQVCPNTTRSHGILYVNKDWQTALSPTDPEQVLLYSAFYDDRQADNRYLPVLRVLGITTTKANSSKSTIINVFSNDMHCHVWYAGKDHPIVTDAKQTIVGPGVVKYGVRYVEIVYTCELVFTVPYPAFVSIVKGRKCDSGPSILEVQVPIRSHWTKTFGMCVGYTSGDMDHNYLIEWMEMNLMFGVEHFTIYHDHLSKGALSVLKNYELEGVVTLRETLPPLLEKHTKEGLLSRLITINDCLYRNMYHYKYILVGEFTHVIVPRYHDNYESMMSHIYQLETGDKLYNSYVFSNVNFWLNLAPDFSDQSSLFSVRFTTRTIPDDPKNERGAPVINPRMCVFASSHACHWSLQRRSEVMHVKPSLALSHTYENCQLTSQRCESLRRGTVTDQTVKKFYGEQLDQRVKSRFQMVSFDD